MEKNEPEFHKNLEIMFLKYVHACVSGWCKGWAGATLPDLFCLGQNLQFLVFLHPLLLIVTGGNFQV